MEDEVFVPLMIPNLSCPPPGWGHEQASLYQQHQGRGKGGNGHHTRVIRRTDLRGKGGQRQQQNQRPPRFNTAQSSEGIRKSWGEEWKPEMEEKKSKDDVVDGLHERDSGDEEGEWKEVKGRRWTKTEESKKIPPKRSPDLHKPRKKTPEPVVQKRSPVSKEAVTPSIHGQMSPEFPRPGKRYSANRKSPDFFENTSSENQTTKSSNLHENKSLHQKVSVKQKNSSKPVQTSSHRKSPDMSALETSPETSRKSSNSSNEGEKSMIFRNKKRSPTFEKRSRTHARTSPPPRLQEKKMEDSSNFLEQTKPENRLSQIPCEVKTNSSLPAFHVPSIPPLFRKLSEFEIKVRDEEAKLKVQKDILVFLKKNWREVSKELEETGNEWSPRVTYYSNPILI